MARKTAPVRLSVNRTARPGPDTGGDQQQFDQNEQHDSIDVVPVVHGRVPFVLFGIPAGLFQPSHSESHKSCHADEKAQTTAAPALAGNGLWSWGNENWTAAGDGDFFL